MDKVAFSGRIEFVNKESYKNFIGYRKEINKLKHRCANNHVTHHIQHDRNIFAITTNYTHQIKTDGTSEHVLSFVLPYPNREKIKKLIDCHISNIKTWKFKIDILPNLNTPDIEPAKKASFFAKIFKIFKNK